MEVDVLNAKNEKVGTVELPDDVFGAKVNLALLWEQVKAQRASWRRGTHATKTRGEVSGGGAKPFKQKGGGRARQGSSRSPVMVGGGTALGPKPRDYSYRLPRSARRSALRSALSARAAEGRLVMVDQLAFEQPSTKAAAEILSRFTDGSALVVDATNESLERSVRNLAKAKFQGVERLNVYDILQAKTLVLTKQALPGVVERARSAGKKNRAAAAA